VESEGRLRQISERDFRRLCGNVWADCLIQFEDGDANLPASEREVILLACVCRELREALELNDWATQVDSASRCRAWIDGVMANCMAEPFGYQKILDRLVREAA
jgi:hypothetical protein